MPDPISPQPPAVQERVEFPPAENPTPKLRNAIVALLAIVLTTALVLGTRFQSQVPSLSRLAAESVPLDTALANGKPTFLEFYADWCASCQTMAPTIGDLKSKYSDRLNFVMLNVDNDKWLPELLAYRVDGIPHFVYLDPKGTALGEAIGEQPKEVLSANLEALANQMPLPFSNAIQGDQSQLDRPFSLSNTPQDPRSHGGV